MALNRGVTSSIGYIECQLMSNFGGEVALWGIAHVVVVFFGGLHHKLKL